MTEDIRPDHYSTGNGNDLIDLFKMGLLSDDQFRGFCKGNVHKYITRYQDKNGVEDLTKARTYLDFLIDFENGKQQTKVVVNNE